MADIFREVDEEVRQDRIQQIVVRNWGWILLVALLLMAGVGGWRFYDYWRQQNAEADGGRYLDALKLAHDGKGAEAIKALDSVSQTGKSGYVLLSRFRAAAEIGQENAQDGAAAYDKLAADGTIDPALQDVARLRAAALVVDTVDLKEMRRRLDALADANSALRNPARELLAVSALKINDYDAAGGWLDSIVTDPTATSSTRQRAEAMLAIVRSGKTAKG